MSSSTPSVIQLQRAVKIAEQIQVLQAELANVLGSTGAPGAKRAYTKKAAAATPAESAASSPAKKKRKKRTKGKMSAEGRAAIVAAQKARWAKIRKAKG